jgi:hypothetical protein
VVDQSFFEFEFIIYLRRGARILNSGRELPTLLSSYLFYVLLQSDYLKPMKQSKTELFFYSSQTSYSLLRL